LFLAEIFCFARNCSRRDAEFAEEIPWFKLIIFVFISALSAPLRAKILRNYLLFLAEIFCFARNCSRRDAEFAEEIPWFKLIIFVFISALSAPLRAKILRNYLLFLAEIFCFARNCSRRDAEFAEEIPWFKLIIFVFISALSAPLRAKILRNYLLFLAEIFCFARNCSR
jgi:hypothetical protein